MIQFCRRAKGLAAIVFLVASTVLGAAEYTEGRIKLVLDEKTGRFSLYYMTDLGLENYVPLFYSADPRTSFLSVRADNRNYRMGETVSFRHATGGAASDPELTFESNSLAVSERFSFIRTAGSVLANGVQITITITNKSERSVRAGARFLLDTSLGEGNADHFSTAAARIISEAAIPAGSGEGYWASGSGSDALMGSVSADGFTEPDLVHFANWKRLNEVSWKMPVSSGRNFNLLPYSIGDSAVCYYFEPSELGAGQSRSITLALAAHDSAGFAGFSRSFSGELTRFLSESAERLSSHSREAMRSDLILLRDLGAFIDSRAGSGQVSDAELEAISTIISRLKAKYGVP